MAQKSTDLRSSAALNGYNRHNNLLYILRNLEEKIGLIF